MFSEVVGTLSFLQPQCDDDISDRLHYYWTTTLLLVVAVLVSLKMFGGRPIECWMPAEYQKSWQEYTEIYCFSMNTYFTPMTSQIPEDNADREENMISYYQWLPFFLVICAFLFYSPCLIWRLLYTKSGIQLKDIIAFATDRSNIQPKMREANMKGISMHLSSCFRHRFRWGSIHPYHHRFLRLLNLRFYEAYLTFLYIGIKLLFLLNVTIQMLLLNWFLQTDRYSFYGWGVIQDLFQGKPWSDTANFPRVTYCDMDIRILGNIQRHTVQCVLVINIFTEKVFVLLWIWYTVLVLVTIISLINWLISSIPFDARKRFIARRLELADVEFKRVNFQAELDDFVRNYIKIDGVFVLRMLTIHAGILVCTEIVDQMWDSFVELNIEKYPKLSPTVLEGEQPAVSPSDSAAAADKRHQLSLRRKTSVLVPLVSARIDNNGNGNGNGTGMFAALPTRRRPLTALPYIGGGGMRTPFGRASPYTPPQVVVTDGEQQQPHGRTIWLRKPSAQKWRTDRRLRVKNPPPPPLPLPAPASTKPLLLLGELTRLSSADDGDGSTSDDEMSEKESTSRHNP